MDGLVIAAPAGLPDAAGPDLWLGLIASGALIVFPLLTFVLGLTGYRRMRDRRVRFAGVLIASGLMTLIAIAIVFFSAMIPAPLRNADWAEFGVLFLLVWTALSLWRSLQVMGMRPIGLTTAAMIAACALPLSVLVNAVSP